MSQSKRGALVLLLLIGMILTACRHDKGDPVAISRDFIVAFWSANTDRVDDLICDSDDDQLWRETILRETRSGDSRVKVDASKLKFEITSQKDDQVKIVMSGSVVFTSPEGLQEVRDLDQTGNLTLILVDQHGWKVCDVRGT
jgi:hypothetical protein